MTHKAGTRILKNATILVAIEILSKVLGMAVIIIAARRLGVTNFGLLAFASAFTEIFGVIVTFGFNMLIIREVARDPSRASRLMGDVFIMQGTLAVLSLVGMVIALNVVGAHGTKLQLSYIVGLSTIFNACLTSLNSFFRARQSVEYEGMVRFSFSALRAILVSTVLLLGYGVLAYALAEFLAYLACLLFSFYLLQRLVARPSFVIDFGTWFNTLRGALPFALMAGVIILYVRADMVILSLLKGDDVTGLYSAATKLLVLFGFVPTSIVGAVLPTMAQQAAQSETLLVRTFAQTFRFLFMLGLPIGLGIGLLAVPIVHLLYGAQFAPAAPAMQILMVGLVLSFLNFAADAALISINQETTLLGIAAIGLVFTMGLNVFLVLHLSYIGASIASVATEGAVLVLKLWVLHHRFGSLPLTAGLGKIVLSGLVMSAFLLAFHWVSIFVLVAPAALIYAGALLLLGAIGAQEFATVQASIPPAIRRLIPGLSGEVEGTTSVPD